MRIGIDVDGVISDFVHTFKEVVKEKFGIQLNEKDIREHDLYKVLGIKSEEAIELIIETLERDLKTQSNAVESINKLYEKHEIVIVTARPPETLDITKDWLNKHGIRHHELHYAREGAKSEFEGKLDVMIDDHLKEIMSWVDKVPTVIVFDHPWNQSLNIKHSFRRVYSWKEILKILDD